MGRTPNRWFYATAGVALMTLAACSTDTPTENGLTNPPPPLFAVDPIPGAISGSPTVAVRVCKVALDAETLGDNFTFNTTASQGTVTTPLVRPATNLADQAGCGVVWARSEFRYDNETDITITEVVPPGYTLEQISFTGTGVYNLPATITNPASPSVTVRALDGLTVYFKNSFEGTPPPGGEGCTPGYWKVPQHHDSWVPTGYTTNQLISTVFSSSNYGGSTLLQALGFNGGTGLPGAERILLRAAVAALLNAGHPDVDYSWTISDLVDAVNDAIDSASRSTMLALAAELDEDNNSGCTLN